jgi:monooxygenase
VAPVVTAHVDTFTPEGIRLRSGRVRRAELVVTVIGLRMLAFGGVRFRVDGYVVDVSRSFAYRSAMLSGLPNFAFCMGYANASWTLRADLTSRLACRLLKHMDRHGHTLVVSEPTRELVPRPLIELSSCYVQCSIAAFPRQGDRHPWIVSQNHIVDALRKHRASLRRDLTSTG